ncbi:hypothetical protein D3C81_1210310 [compost metagenome]
MNYRASCRLKLVRFFGILFLQLFQRQDFFLMKLAVVLVSHQSNPRCFVDVCAGQTSGGQTNYLGERLA